MQAEGSRLEVVTPDRPEATSPRPAVGGDSTTGDSAGLYSLSDRSAAAHRYRSHLDEMRAQPEVDGRIKALLAPVQMTKRQAEEIIQRIRGGYYLRPEILHAVAAVICTVLESEA